MANTFKVSRVHLIFGICLPLAVLVGYSLASQMDSQSLAVIFLMASVLSFPLLMRWYHPLLILSWNACLSPFFLPGRPYVWMLMALAGCFFALLARAVNPDRKFISVPSMSWAILAVVAVVVVTAYLTGGAGLNSLGGNVNGGKFYFYVFLALIGYYAFISQSVPLERAGLYVAFFFLSGATSIISSLVYVAGPKFYILYSIFPPDFAMGQAQAENALGDTAVRLGGITPFSQAIWCYMLARYGIQGVMDIRKPLRMLIFLAAAGCGLFGGFRSVLIVFLLAFALLFFLEGLGRTRWLGALAAVGILLGLGLVEFAEKLPFSVQRTICFLPINVDPNIRQDAQASTDWRVEMWKRVLPEVPEYFFMGKGYALNPQDMYLMQESIRRGYEDTYGASQLAGDYHNGPLSIIIPFGLWGVLAFGWLFVASFRILYRNYRFGPEELRCINNFMLALFMARAVMFIFVVGSLYIDLMSLMGLVGLSVALNGGVRGEAALAQKSAKG